MALIKCEECGKEISDRASSCPNCGCPVKSSLEQDDDIAQIKLLKKQGQNVKAIKLYRELTGVGLQEAKYFVDNLSVSQDDIKNIQIRCPKCGYTEFDMVKRNWSLLTGFMTNKVDRVCRNCKTRF